MGRRSSRWSKVAVSAACSLLMLGGCSTTTLDGRAVSMLYDPNRVAGLEAKGGPSGPRPNAPPATGTVENTDNGDVDHASLLAIRDVEDYWTQNYTTFFKGGFTPVSKLVSYNSKDPNSPKVCGRATYQDVNAFFSPRCELIAWDRGTLFPTARQYFTDMSVNGVLAHEYGHAVQRMANLVTDETPGLVFEQQADCFAGVYLRWVAEGHSPRFTLNTTDGLDHVLAGLIEIRDKVLREGQQNRDPHGSALDRISALQIGFDVGPTGCAGIDMAEITKRRGDLPQTLQYDDEGQLQSGEAPINNETLSNLMDTLKTLFNPANPPKLTPESATCPDATVSKPAAYCPSTNTIIVDLPALQEMGKVADTAQGKLLQGDNTAFSVVTSRYMLAIQHERGLPLDTETAALRTACLTGVAQREMANPSGKLVLTAGDVDEAISGLLTNGLAASDVNGTSVPAGFTRIVAYRAGLLGDADKCYQRFP